MQCGRKASDPGSLRTPCGQQGHRPGLTPEEEGHGGFGSPGIRPWTATCTERGLRLRPGCGRGFQRPPRAPQSAEHAWDEDSRGAGHRKQSDTERACHGAVTGLERTGHRAPSPSDGAPGSSQPRQGAGKAARTMTRVRLLQATSRATSPSDLGRKHSPPTGLSSLMMAACSKVSPPGLDSGQS